MSDASPAKWHLAHTTWFFETMVLIPHKPGYRVFDERFAYLFNSYYESVGERHPRNLRGMLTRPSLNEIAEYRWHVDSAVCDLLLGSNSPEIIRLIELGCNHEQQHQELALTDLLHLFSQSPLRPAYAVTPRAPSKFPNGRPREFLWVEGGLSRFGYAGTEFSFDCEGPEHFAHVEGFRLASTLVTCREWLEFVYDGGYHTPLLWLANGWSKVSSEGWSAPLYWEFQGDEPMAMTLGGRQSLALDAPVAHISYYEADAFARWSGKRLPTEYEWELAARRQPVQGNLLEAAKWEPVSAPPQAGFQQMYGDVWEWTSSAFSPYPRFRSEGGALGEYNEKFMDGQYVLRGGSFATPTQHIRSSYRNFFPPHARWQFSGLRLAQDL